MFSFNLRVSKVWSLTTHQCFASVSPLCSIFLFLLIRSLSTVFVLHYFFHLVFFLLRFKQKQRQWIFFFFFFWLGNDQWVEHQIQGKKSQRFIPAEIKDSADIDRNARNSLTFHPRWNRGDHYSGLLTSTRY